MPFDGKAVRVTRVWSGIGEALVFVLGRIVYFCLGAYLRSVAKVPR